MKGKFMKKIIILPLVLVGILALTGCDSYSDFALVEDSETAESTVCMKDIPYSGFINFHNEFIKVHKCLYYTK